MALAVDATNTEPPIAPFVFTFFQYELLLGDTTTGTCVTGGTDVEASGTTDIENELDCAVSLAPEGFIAVIRTTYGCPRRRFDKTQEVLEVTQEIPPGSVVTL